MMFHRGLAVLLFVNLCEGYSRSSSLSRSAAHASVHASQSSILVQHPPHYDYVVHPTRTPTKRRVLSPPSFTSERRKLPSSLLTLYEGPEPSSEASSSSNSDNSKDDLFDGRTTVALVGGQSLLVVAAAVAAFILKTPNLGLGPGFSFTLGTLLQGTLLTLPLAGLAAALDVVEDKYPALQDVSKATQRSVLALMGGTWKPAFALATAMALGLAAGVGEEMLFRGVFQYELATRWGPLLAISLSSIVFGALHSVTPLYAGLATLASVYFGSIYLYFGNLAIPIATHAIYDVGALLYAHWTVSQFSEEERREIADWEGPTIDPL
jgi:membrane protease YdiL (CAAX protease family)